jgi:glyoxylase-like metal-dependent hydrolase (beta-lactamase superfamily II)
VSQGYEATKERRLKPDASYRTLQYLNRQLPHRLVIGAAAGLGLLPVAVDPWPEVPGTMKPRAPRLVFGVSSQICSTKPNWFGFPSFPLRIGRASGSESETRRSVIFSPRTRFLICSAISLAAPCEFFESRAAPSFALAPRPRAFDLAFAASCLASRTERASSLDVDRTIEPGETVLEVGKLKIGALLTPGHTGGMLNFVVNGTDVFTGDTLFKNSVGGVRAPGSTSFEDLKHSVMEVLMGLDPATRLHPGHTDPTTVGEEWESNSFIRVWRGLDPESSERCTVWEDPATLVHWGDDYDGGHKAWVRWDESGKDDIVPGSQVVRED